MLSHSRVPMIDCYQVDLQQCGLDLIMTVLSPCVILTLVSMLTDPKIAEALLMLDHTEVVEAVVVMVAVLAVVVEAMMAEAKVVGEMVAVEQM